MKNKIKLLLFYTMSVLMSCSGNAVLASTDTVETRRITYSVVGPGNFEYEYPTQIQATAYASGLSEDKLKEAIQSHVSEVKLTLTSNILWSGLFAILAIFCFLGTKYTDKLRSFTIRNVVESIVSFVLIASTLCSLLNIISAIQNTIVYNQMLGNPDYQFMYGLLQYRSW